MFGILIFLKICLVFGFIYIVETIKTNNEGWDKLEWLPFLNKSNPVKHIYESQFHSAEDISWVWELPARLREKVFMWRFLMGAIPTASWLNRRGFNTDCLCPWGCDTIEDIAHIICGCNFSKDIMNWFARLGFKLDSFENLQDFCSYIQSNTHRSCLSTHLYIATIYQLWKVRNAYVHGKKYQSPLFIAISILNSIQNIKFLSTDRTWSATSPSGLFAAWHPPPERWIKVNLDSSFSGDNYATIAIFVRGHDGKFIKACGRKIYASSAVDTEILAADSFVSIVDEEILEAHGIILEGDSMEAYKRIKANVYWKNASSLQDFDFSFLSNFNNIVINCIRRDFNRAADYCAKAARSGDFILLHEQPLPNELNAILESDYG